MTTPPDDDKDTSSAIPFAERITLRDTPIARRVTLVPGTYEVPGSVIVPPIRPSQNIATVHDGARRDGGKTTEDETIPPANLAKVIDKAIENTRDQVGS